MSLLSKSLVRCRTLIKSETRTANGSRHTGYKDGKSFLCALVYDKSVSQKTGFAADVSDTYTVYLPLDTTLNFHDVFMRLADKKVFRVTSNGEDRKPPAGSGIPYRVVTAEIFDCEVMKL